MVTRAAHDVRGPTPPPLSPGSKKWATASDVSTDGLDSDTHSTDSESLALSAERGRIAASPAAAAAAPRTYSVRPALDAYGFVIRDDGPPPNSASAGRTGLLSALSPRERASSGRANRDHELWLQMLAAWPQWNRLPHRVLLKRRVRRGIPDALRAHVWSLCAGSSAATRSLPPYETLVDKCAPSVVDEIERDVRRTFPDHEIFVHDERRAPLAASGTPDGVRLLGRVLAAYAAAEPSVRYCQGLNLLCGVLLMYAPEARAFSLLVALTSTCGMRPMFEDGLPGVTAALDAFDGLIMAQLPRLHMHLVRHGVAPSAYATRWLMTAFIGCLPFEACVRALDCIFYDRDVKILYRLGIAILHEHEASLRALQGTELLRALQEAPARCTDVDALFRRALALEVRRSAINALLVASSTQQQRAPVRLGDGARLAERGRNSLAHRWNLPVSAPLAGSPSQAAAAQSQSDRGASGTATTARRRGGLPAAPRPSPAPARAASAAASIFRAPAATRIVND